MPGSEERTGLRATRIEAITWVLIFGGMAVASLGLFVDRQPGGATLAGVLMLGGLAAVALGVVLIIVRSRMSTPGRPKGEYRSAQREGTPMSPPHGRPKEGSLPLGGTARSAKGAPISDPSAPKAKP